MNDIPKTISDAEAIAAKHGIELTPQDYADMYEVMAVRQAQIEKDQAAQLEKSGKFARVIERFNQLYPKFLETLLGVGDVLITMTQTVLIAFGIPCVLLMLLIVEQQRVYHGVSLFEVYDYLAEFSAVALVALNLIVELLISWVEHSEGYKAPTKQQFSFYIVRQWWRYVVGKDVTPRPKSPALRFKVVLRIVTFSILTLALAGSMKSVITGTEGNWYTALYSVITKSTLLQMATWIGGLMYAVAAVLSAQALSQYIAEKVVEVIAIMQSKADNKPKMIADAIGLSGATFLYSRIQERKQARRATVMVSAADMPVIRNELSGVIPLPVSSVSSPETIETGSIAPNDDFSVSPVSPVSSPETIETDIETSPIELARQWLLIHPNMDGLTVREAAKLIGVSPATLSRAKSKQ